jgi:Fe-S-cluster-containing dehydrogenase component
MSQSLDLHPETADDLVARLATGEVSRRGFVGISGAAAVGVFASSLFANVPFINALTGAMPILSDSKGVLIHDITRCVGCRRCELACTEFNDGAASSYLARIKVARNLAYTGGSDSGPVNVPGKHGNFRIQADTCKQCPHPVPCATACPHDAIVEDAKTGARRVDEALCVGCGLCTRACPWAVITVNKATQKASKCYLCDGSPECARACPTGALKYVSWRDLRLSTPVVQPSALPPTSTVVCADCH